MEGSLLSSNGDAAKKNLCGSMPFFSLAFTAHGLQALVNNPHHRVLP